MHINPKSTAPVLPPFARLFLLGLAGSVALALVILIFSASTAATSTGAAPSLAISLTGEMGTGILAPGETRWYKFNPSRPGQAGHIEQSLTLFFTPGEPNQARQVSFRLFEEATIMQGKHLNFGAGQIVSRDNNPRSGELFWTGWLFEDQGYYIQLVNSNEEAVDYWLLTDDVSSYPVDGPTETTAPVAVAPTELVQPLAASQTPDGHSPQTAIPFQTERLQGQLTPGQTVWYTLSVTGVDQAFFEETALTLFATPNDNNQIQKLTFELFTAEEAQRWAGPDTTHLNNIGAGSLAVRDNDPLTGERFWAGWLVERSLYYIRVQNGATQVMDYTLFLGDVYNPQLGGDSN